MPFPALVGLLLLWQGAASSLAVLLVDGSNRPLPGVRIELKAAGQLVSSIQTDEKGRAEFSQLKAARYELDAVQDGFEPVQTANLELPASVELTLTPALARKESIEVRDALPHNLSNHYNPEAFHNNVANPAFGLFFGQRGRHFTADFDVIF